ncbi:MAG: GNAT family N-acetyltransferase [Acidimicrobiales bacterium]|jgi:GNAT superfamily N-acetyltransferase
MDFSIREPTVSDAASMARVHVRSWQAAYAGIVDQATLDGLDVAERTATWTARLSVPGDGPRLVAEVDREIVGFLVGVRRSPDTADAAEVLAIYLDPGAWRRGVGSALLDAGVDRLRVEETAPIVLWVLEGNERARRFYEARGWRLDGGRRDERIGDERLSDLRYRLD